MSYENKLVSHLSDLRLTLIRIFLTILFGSIVCWFFSDKLFSLVRNPISGYLNTETGGLIFTGVTDKFFAHMKIALLGGIILTCPVWLYQIWNFVSPGLYKHEKKTTIFFVSIGSLLFIFGVSFVYFVLFPVAFDFFLNFGDGKDMAMISIKQYLSFFFTTVLVFGLAFELPLTVGILRILGVVDKNFLKKARSYAYVLLALISAFVTPPDVVSMFLFLVPMIILYEFSIFIVNHIPRILGMP